MLFQSLETIHFKSGFLLIELMISFFILSFIALASSSWYNYAVYNYKSSVYKLKALMLCSSCLECAKVHISNANDIKSLPLLFNSIQEHLQYDSEFKVVYSYKNISPVLSNNNKISLYSLTVTVLYSFSYNKSLVSDREYSVSLATILS